MPPPRGRYRDTGGGRRGCRIGSGRCPTLAGHEARLRGGRHRSRSVLAGITGLLLAVVALAAGPAVAAPGDPPAPDPAPAVADRHLAAGSETRLKIGGGSSVPADASAVALNVTATDATMPGYVSLFPCGQPRPQVSNLNYVPGQTVANAAIVPLGQGGKVCMFTFSPVNVVVDVAGWYAPGAFGAVAPARLVDTRRHAVPPR